MSSQIKSTRTNIIYARAQFAFSEWCREQNITEPQHEDVARYLVACFRERGPSPVPVHLSAIANLFRSQGRQLDTKSDVIQSVVAPLRKTMMMNRSNG